MIEHTYCKSRDLEVINPAAKPKEFRCKACGSKWYVRRWGKNTGAGTVEMVDVFRNGTCEESNEADCPVHPIIRRRKSKLGKRGVK